MVWGGRLLGRLGKKLPTAEPYGESWEVSDHAVAHSIVAEGPCKGSSLADLMRDQRADLLGSAADRHRTFPWLFKFLDAHDWLSVQVHPDETAAKTLCPGEGPKNEAWFILEAQPGSLVYAGLLPGVGPADLRAALAKGTIADCLHRFAPRPGDFLYLPAGTVHALGGGVLMAEIQQTSDATFRLFDWSRRDAQGNSRKLHVEESLACIDWTRGPVRPISAAGFGGPERVRTALARTPYFHLSYVQETAPFHLGGNNRLEAMCVFSGRAVMASGEVMQPGQVWLVPAAMKAVECRPDAIVGALSAVLPLAA